MTEGVYYQDKNIFRFRELNLEVMRIARGSGFSYQFDTTVGAVVLTLARRMALQGKDLKQLEAALAKDYAKLCEQYTDYINSLDDDALIELYNKLRYPSELLIKHLESRLPEDTIKSLAEDSDEKSLNGRDCLFSEEYWPRSSINISDLFSFGDDDDEDEDDDDDYDDDDEFDDDLSFLNDDINGLSRKVGSATSAQMPVEAKTEKVAATDDDDDLSFLDEDIKDLGSSKSSVKKDTAPAKISESPKSSSSSFDDDLSFLDEDIKDLSSSKSTAKKTTAPAKAPESTKTSSSSFDDDLSFLDEDIKDLDSSKSTAKKTVAPAKVTETQKTSSSSLDNDLSFLDEDFKDDSASKKSSDSDDDNTLVVGGVLGAIKKFADVVGNVFGGKRGDQDQNDEVKATAQTTATPVKQTAQETTAPAVKASVVPKVELSQADLNNFVDFDDLEDKEAAVKAFFEAKLSKLYPEAKKVIESLDAYSLKALNILLGDRTPSAPFFHKAFDVANFTPAELLGEDYNAGREECISEIEEKLQGKKTNERVQVVKGYLSDGYVDTPHFLGEYKRYLDRMQDLDVYDTHHEEFISEPCDRLLLGTVNYSLRLIERKRVYEEHDLSTDQIEDYLGHWAFELPSLNDNNSFYVTYTDSVLDHAKTLKYRLGQDVTWQNLAKICTEAAFNTTDHFAEISKMSLADQVKEAYKIAQKFNFDQWSYFTYKHDYEKMNSMSLFDLSGCSTQVQRLYAVLFNLLFNNTDTLSTELLKVKPDVIWSDKVESSKFFRKVDANVVAGGVNKDLDILERDSFIEKIIDLTQQSEVNLMALLRGWFASTQVFNPYMQNYVYFSTGLKYDCKDEVSVLVPLLLVWTELIRYVELSKIMATVVSYNKTNRALYPNLTRALEHGNLALDIYKTMADTLFSGLLAQRLAGSKHCFDFVFIALRDFMGTLENLTCDCEIGVKLALKDKICTAASHTKYWQQGLRQDLLSLYGRLQDFGVFELQNYLGFVYFERDPCIADLLQPDDSRAIDGVFSLENYAAKYVWLGQFYHLPVHYNVMDYIPHEVALKEMIEPMYYENRGDSSSIHIDPECTKLYIGDQEFEIVFDHNMVSSAVPTYNPTDKSLLLIIYDGYKEGLLEGLAKNQEILTKLSKEFDDFRLGLINVSVCKDFFGAHENTKAIADVAQRILETFKHCSFALKRLAQVDTKLLPDLQFNHTMSQVVYKGVTFNVRYEYMVCTSFVIRYAENLPLTLVMSCFVPSVEFYQRLALMLDNAIKTAKSNTKLIGMTLFHYYRDQNDEWYENWKVPTLLDDNTIIFRDLKFKLRFNVKPYTNCFEIGNAPNDADGYFELYGPSYVCKDKQHFNALITFLSFTYTFAYGLIFKNKEEQIRKSAQRFSVHIRTLKTNVNKFAEVATEEQAGRVEALKKLVARIDEDYASIKKWSSTLLEDISHYLKHCECSSNKFRVVNTELRLLSSEIARFEKAVELALNRIEEYKTTVKSWLPKKTTTTKKASTKATSTKKASSKTASTKAASSKKSKKQEEQE